MSARRLSFNLLPSYLVYAVIALLLLLPRLGWSQESPAPAVENSKYQAAGAVNANAVFVRSGPSDNDYPVLKLDKGAELQVVGVRFEWLKVVPPEGSFCYVAKAYVEKFGDGTRGKVTNTLNVRVGSTLNPMKTKLAMKLDPGAEVAILGDQDEYFKITPPQGVYLYVNKQFVDAVKVIAQNPEPNTVAAGNNAEGGAAVTSDTKATEAVAKNEPGEANSNAVKESSPTTAPAAVNNESSGPTAAPSTQPAVADAEAEFDRLEIAYADMVKKPLDEQDIPSLLNGYEALAGGTTTLPESLRRVAEAKAALLKARDKDRAEFIAVKKHQEEVNARQTALKAERDEIEQRLHTNEVKYFTAVGVLRPSSLQQGNITLYRLTDPSNGRTVVYLRTNDTKIGLLLGQFIGVKGELATDSQLSLRVINPNGYEACDPTKLYTNIAAQIVPPSLMPGASNTATTGNE